jgi:hypothetical protein
MRNLLIVALLLALIVCQGCSISFTGGVAADAFYPEAQTAKGGSFGDPHASRREATRPTTSHMRNNDGGNSVDEALRKFFNTK